jgi:hypothetical protein
MKNKDNWVFEISSGYDGYRNKETGQWIYKADYDLIFGQKEETLEEFAERMSMAFDVNSYKALSQLVVDGAEYMKSRMYSEEEVKQILFHRETEYLKIKNVLHINEWFEQFKKK